MLSLYKTFIQNNLTTLIVYIIIVCLLSIERVAIPHMYGKLLESLRAAKFDETTMLFGIVVSIFVVFQILDTVLTYIDAKLMPQFEAFVRRHVVDVIIDRHTQHYAELDLGNITSKLIKLPTNLNTLFYRAKTFLFNHVFSIIVAVGYLFYCHPYLGGIFTVAFGLLALFTWSFCYQCSTPSYNRDATFDQMQESIQDILYNLQSVYVNRTQKEERDRIDVLNDHTVKRVQEWVFCGIPYRVIFAALFLTVFAGVTWTSIWLYRNKKLSLALLVSSFMVTFAILRTCISFYHDFEDFIYVNGGMQVVSDYIDSLPENCEHQEKHLTRNTIPKHPKHDGVDIVFDRVTFVPERPSPPPDIAVPPSHLKDHASDHASDNASDTSSESTPSSPSTSSPSPTKRPTSSSKPLFHNFSLHLPAGKHVAVMGGIGSGKTTLAHLLMKLRCPTSGTITFNGTPIDQLPTAVVRQTVHYVPQHPRLFNRTLWENIVYGNPDTTLTDTRVYTLLESLQLHDVLRVFRQKMHQPVGKQGSLLSGGQRQIVVLLRAVFNTHAKVLILDEPTSALDETSRDQVLKLVGEVAKGRTLVVITHDSGLVGMTEGVIRLG